MEADKQPDVGIILGQARKAAAIWAPTSQEFMDQLANSTQFDEKTRIQHMKSELLNAAKALLATQVITSDTIAGCCEQLSGQNTTLKDNELTDLEIYVDCSEKLTTSAAKIYPNGKYFSSVGSLLIGRVSMSGALQSTNDRRVHAWKRWTTWCNWTLDGVDLHDAYT